MKIHNDPAAKMKVVTKCERVQPYISGVDETGELIWEGRTMPRWQMELVRVTPKWFGDFFMRWMEVNKMQENANEFRAEDNHVPSIAAKSKTQLNEMRVAYVRKYRRAIQGD